MADPYVIFPGTAGNYLSTPDVNLLDADTAHMVQAMPWSASQATIVDNGILPSGWGSALLTVTAVSASVRAVRAGISVPVTPGVLTLTATVDNTTAGDVAVNFVVFDGVGALSSVYEAIPPGISEVAHQVTVTGTGVTQIWVQFDQNTLAVSDELVVSEIMLAQGTWDSFVPSLRIVGDLDLEADFAYQTAAGSRQIIGNTYLSDGYGLSLNGELVGIAHADGSSTRSQSQSFAPLVDGTRYAVRVTFDVSTGAVVYYKDGVEVGTDSAAVGAGSPSGEPVTVGATSDGAAYFWAADVYSAVVRDGIDGPLVAEFLASDVPVAAQLPA